MNFRRVISAVSVCLLLVAFGLPVQAAQVSGQASSGALRQVGPGTGSINGQPAVEGEVVVRFASSSSAEERRDIRASLDATRSQSLGMAGLQLLKLHSGGVESAIASLEQQSDVLYAEPNYIYEATDIPNDPSFGQLWGLNNTGQTVNGVAGTPDADIDAPEAWDTETGSSNVVVAVVDSGITHDHPDLAPNMWSNPGETPGNGTDDDGNGFIDDTRGWDFIGADNDPFDLNLHGTHVAGTIGAQGDNSTGVAGVNWDVSLMALRALNNAGSGTNAGITAAFNYAGDNGADVVNASLSGGGFSQAMSDAITGAPNTLFVVAAGNDASNNNTTPVFPCNYTAANNICVAATTSTDALAPFSNRGATHVDLAAPGTSIFSTLPNFESQFSETFSDGAGWTGRWTTGGTNNSWGLQSNGAATFLADSPGGDYLANTNAHVRRSSGSNLSGLRGCKLDFSAAWEIESDFDALHIEQSTNGTTWSAPFFLDGTTNGTFFRLSVPLGGLDGQPQAFVGFRLTSDSTANFDGANLDDIDLMCIESGYDGDEYGFLDGTSMASPHVAGAAALLLAADPTATVAELRSALLGGVDPKASLTGQVATGGRLNLKKSLDLLVPPTDNDPPETNITSGPANGSTTSSTSASFGFTSDEAGSTFECKLDSGAFESCTNPKGYSGLADGSHTFSVQATDAADNTDPTPATRTWTIDTTDNDPPNTRITSGPSGRIKKRNAGTLRFRFNSTEAGSTFKCKRNGGPWASCSSPKVYRRLPLGKHTFRVRATDQAGNTDPTPAKRVFRIVRN